MNKLIAAERHNEILKVLDEQGSIKISQLAELFHVSKETIRKDLLYLDEIGELKKSHGGAVSIKDTSKLQKTLSIEDRIDVNMNVKNKLASEALSLLPKQGVIFLDSGTTVQCIAQLLRDTSGYTIITTSLNSAFSLSGTSNVVLLAGGQINYTTMSMEGFQTLNILNGLKADIAFLGSNGFDQHQGPASSELNDSSIKKEIIKNSKINVVVTDSTKCSYTSLMQYADWSEIDYVVTDHNLTEEYQEMISPVSNLIMI